MLNYIPYHLGDFVREYERTSSGHFFSKDNMRFFKSRLIHSLFLRDTANKCIYFVTSEKKCFNDPTRVFSLRKATLHRKKWQINTVDGFHGVTKHKCSKEIKRIEGSNVYVSSLPF